MNPNSGPRPGEHSDPPTTDPSPSYRGRAKYDDNSALKYQQRKASKHAAELRLVDRAFALIPKSHRVLDVPCGGGRVSIHLAQSGYSMTSADLSDSMLAIALEQVRRHGLDIPVKKLDIENLACPARHFDTIISFRLFHHFPTSDIRQRVIAELCRVARKYVAISYFSPASVTSLKRALRRKLGGKSPDKFATPLKEVESYFTTAGFRLVKDFPQLRYWHTLHLALFQRGNERD